MRAKLVLFLLRVSVGAVFVYAALAKFREFDTFAEEIANYRMLPPITVPFVAAMMPGVELLAGGLLIANRWTRAAATLLAVLLGVFIVALSQALLRGINLTCGCFGGSEPATWGTVVRDVVLLVAALAQAWFAPPSRPAIALTPPEPAARD